MQIVAIDLDNVISETDIKIREIIRKKYGLRAERKDITDFNYEDCLPITREQAQDVLREFHRCHLLSLRVVRGAKSALKVIASNFKVVIVTERPIETKEHTIWWLQARNIPFQEVVFVKDKEELLTLGLSWFIDDKWENAIRIANKRVRTILFDRPWNRKGIHELIQRAYGWNGVLDSLGIRNPST